MNWLFIITFYITSIISIKTDSPGEIVKKVDKNRLDLNITQDEKNITVEFKYKEYIPAGGIWVSEMLTIHDSEFQIEGINFYKYITEKIFDKYSLERFMNKANSLIYKNIASKENFYKKANNLELGLVIYKNEDFRKLVLEFLDLQKSRGTHSSSVGSEAERKFKKKLHDSQNIYIVMYNNKANEIPSDLNDYELYIYKQAKVGDSFKITALLKKCAFDVIVSAWLTFTFFGILMMAGRYSLSKYF